MHFPRSPHRWKVSPKQAVAIQRRFAARVIRSGTVPKNLDRVAGADVAFSRDGQDCIAAVVVWSIREQAVVEQHVARRPLLLPYIPGLLSFREAPALLAVLRKLKYEPDAFIFDGQGLAHPRRLGLACHVGLILDRPSLGCAKSVLVGKFDSPSNQIGNHTPMMHRGETIGAALGTRLGVKPVYVSIGHRLNLQQAIRIVLSCCIGYRLPEPTRLADQLVSKRKGDKPVG